MLGTLGDFREMLYPLPPPSGGRLEGGTARPAVPLRRLAPETSPLLASPAGGRCPVLYEGSSFSELALVHL